MRHMKGCRGKETPPLGFISNIICNIIEINKTTFSFFDLILLYFTMFTWSGNERQYLDTRRAVWMRPLRCTLCLLRRKSTPPTLCPSTISPSNLLQLRSPHDRPKWQTGATTWSSTSTPRYEFHSLLSPCSTVRRRHLTLEDTGRPRTHRSPGGPRISPFQ